jgi:Na+-transporting methylmalonyl-CoA/oxaloacetate decarboxylase gamma subunit
MQLYGLEAINEHNGWAMAVVGAAIVFSGLVILSFAISQIKRILSFFENRNQPQETAAATDENLIGTIAVPETFCNDVTETAMYYRPLTDQLGDSFQLSELYKICGKYNFPSPHLNIRSLRAAGILLAEGNGFFRWIQP